MTYVSTTQELNTALANVNVKKIVLNNNLTANFSATRKIDFDLNGKTLTGNVSYDTDAEGTILLSNGTITGNLTVDTPSVSFTNSATVNGTTTIKDVANNTFTNNGLLNIVIIQDVTGTPRFVNGQNSQIQNLVIDTIQPVNLQGGFTKVTVKQDTQLNLANGSVINDLNTDVNVQATVSGGTVKDTSGNGEVVIDDEEVAYPEVQIKGYVTYRVSKEDKNFYGVQARIVLPADQHAALQAGDRVVVSLMNGDKVLSTSTTKEPVTDLVNDVFKNEFANEKHYASTLFVPNGSYPSGTWDTTAWDASYDVKPNRLKVEIKRDGKVISSTVSTVALDETFTDGSSKVALSWEQILKENEVVVNDAMLKINTEKDPAKLKAVVESEALNLSLNLGGYNALYDSEELGDYGQGDRQIAVITDILANRVNVKVETWTLEQFTDLFNAAVENRTATQDALFSVNSAVKAADLKVEEFIGKVKVAYAKNQEVLPKVSGDFSSATVVQQLDATITHFESLEEGVQASILEELYNNGDNYASWSEMAEAFGKAMQPVQLAE